MSMIIFVVGPDSSGSTVLWERTLIPGESGWMQLGNGERVQVKWIQNGVNLVSEDGTVDLSFRMDWCCGGGFLSYFGYVSPVEERAEMLAHIDDLWQPIH